MRRLLAATVAIAMAATMVHAEPGNGNKDGKDRGAQTDNGGGGGPKADRGPQMRGNSDRGAQMRGSSERGAERRDDDRSEHQVERRDDRRDERRTERRDEGGDGRAADRPDRRADSREDRVKRRIEREIRDDRRGDRVFADRSRDGDRRTRRTVDFDFRESRGLIDGCPPGLAKKNNGCMPPGLAGERGAYRYRDTFYRPDWWGYDRLGADRVYYDDGYLYRLGSNNSVLGYIPLLGGALSIGNPWPSYYDPVPVPGYYVDYFNLGPQSAYRYADDVLYRVDPKTAAITSIAALLTGDEFTVGQPMPLGYDVYNVPYAYRDRYYDRPDAWYRYSDGYVYQVDPETRLVAAAIELLI